MARLARGAIRRVRAAFGVPLLPGFEGRVRRAYGRLPQPADDAATLTLIVGRKAHGLESSAYIRLLGPLLHGDSASRFRLDFADAEGAAAVPIGRVVIVQREVMPDADAAAALLDRIRAAGARLVVDCDDDFRLFDPNRAAALDLLIRHADQAWFSTAVLADSHRDAAGERAVVVPNALDPHLWGPRAGPRPRAGTAFRILYMGTRTHDADLAAILPALDAFAAERPDMELHLIGAVTADPGRAWCRVAPIPRHAVEYPSFVRWLQRQGPFDLGIAPLAYTAFNAAKSDVKFLDYCALGLPSLLADLPPYRDPLRPDGLARLVPGDAGAWLAALRAHDLSEAAAGRERRLDHVWNGRPLAAIAERQRTLIAALLGG